ncbi:hypothetical protein KAR91_77720, partial [Candidatus Pacearchaeota archaeon]|nr:hypothetical protein [Candidatus Pacearchaeota archaeon]
MKLSKPKFFRIQTKLELSFVTLAVTTCGLLAVALFMTTKHQMRHDVRRRLRDVVSVAALQIDADGHSELTDISHEKSRAYLQIKEVLKQIRDSGEDFRFVYTWRFNDKGQLVFVVDAESDPEEISHLGDVYEDADETLLSLLSNISGPEVDKGFTFDRWGAFLSGYAPFYRSDGQLEGIVGIDIEASSILADERHFLWIVLSVFCLVTPFAYLLGRLLGRRISKPIIALKEGTDRIKAGY